MSDLIERQKAIDVLDAYQVKIENGEENPYAWARLRMSELPSAEPQIIYCKDCKKHNKARGYSYDGTFVGIMDACPLVEIRGKAQGHEFDYQYCVYAKRRE